MVLEVPRQQPVQPPPQPEQERDRHRQRDRASHGVKGAGQQRLGTARLAIVRDGLADPLDDDGRQFSRVHPLAARVRVENHHYQPVPGHDLDADLGFHRAQGLGPKSGFRASASMRFLMRSARCSAG